MSKDEHFLEAARTVIKSGRVSTGMLQRKFRIGALRAVALASDLEEMGVVSRKEPAKPQRILMTMDQLESLIAVK